MGLFSDIFGGSAREDVRAGARQAEKLVRSGKKQGQEALENNFTSGADYLTKGRDDAVSSLESFTTPMYLGGVSADNRYGNEYASHMGVNGKAAQQAAFDKFETSPGFENNLEWGQKVAERSAAARGFSTAPRLAMELRDYGHRSMADEYRTFLDRLERGAESGANRQLQADSTMLNAKLQASGQAKDAATSVASIKSNTGGQLADLFSNKGTQLAALHTGSNGTLANLAIGKANAVANSRFNLGDLSGFLGDAMKAFAKGPAPT